MNIALIDYRAGNLTSVRKALGAVGAEVYTPEQAGDLQRADGIIVPGVGHFNVTATLDAPWREAVRAHVVDRKRPLLGICLGLQWLFEGSEEAPDLPGMGLLPGHCHLLRARDLKVPHVGWNTLDTVTERWQPKARRRRACCGTCPIRRMRISRIRTSRQSPTRAWRRPRMDRRSRRWWNAAS